MNVGLLLVRAAAGVVAGVLVFYPSIKLPVDAWVPILVVSIVASAAVAAVNAGARTSHYEAWSTRIAGRPRGATSYVLTQTMLGLPVVGIVTMLAWAATFASLVAP